MFLIQRLQLLLRSFELIVRTLQFFIGTFQFFVAGFEFLVGRRLSLNSDLQVFFGVLQFLFKLSCSAVDGRGRPSTMRSQQRT